MKLSRFTVILDACVLYPAPLRDLLIQLAYSDLYRAKWTEKIEDEWVAALLKNRPDLSIEQLRPTCQAMRDSVSDYAVTGWETLMPGLMLPDENDRHVLAAAIHAKCDAIVTSNLADFPSDIVGTFDIEVLHPDDFLHFQFGFSEAAVITAVQKIRRRLRNPPIDANSYIDRLERLGLPKIAAALRPFATVL